MRNSSFSDCSYPEHDAVDDISTTFAKLKSILSEEATLRKQLDTLFTKQEEEAREAVRKAQSHLAFVKEEQANMKQIIRQESIIAYGMAFPTGEYGVDGKPIRSFPTPPLGTPVVTPMDMNPSVPEDTYIPPKSPARSIREHHPPSPNRSTHTIPSDVSQPKSSARSTRGIADDGQQQSLALSTQLFRDNDAPLSAPASSTHDTPDKPLQSSSLRTMRLLARALAAPSQRELPPKPSKPPTLSTSASALPKAPIHSLMGLEGSTQKLPAGSAYCAAAPTIPDEETYLVGKRMKRKQGTLSRRPTA